MDQLAERKVDSYSVDSHSAESEAASCDLVQQILALPSEDRCHVSTSACLACAASFPPTATDPNPVVASLAFTAAETRLDQLAFGSANVDALKKRQAFAEAHLPRVLPEEADEGPSDRPSGDLPSLSRGFLDRTLPMPAARLGGRVKRWAVGVTTAPRRQPTVAGSVAELIRCGWSDPHLFVDGQMDLDRSLSKLDVTSRRRSMGAWCNFIMGLTELVEVHPNADAFLMTQDDVRWPPMECLREYLETCLWPDSSGGIVSLYTCADDAANAPGWRALPKRWKYGALAFVLSRSTARRMTCDPWLRKHGWSHGRGVAGVDAAIGQWAERKGLAVWHPTPSLVQHAGHISAIWPTARAVGVRRASTWVGTFGSEQA